MSDGDGCFRKTQNVCPIHVKLAQKLGAMNLSFFLNLKIMLSSFGAKTRGCVNSNYLWAPKIKHVFLQHMSFIKIWVLGPLFWIDFSKIIVENV